MKSLPLLFSGEMVRAIKAGRKTQTRRILKPQPVNSAGSLIWHAGHKLVEAGYGAPLIHTDREAFIRAALKVSRFQPGRTIWVKETHAVRPNGEVSYRADDHTLAKKWSPSIFMRREHARLFLKVVQVRVHRLHELNDDDAKAEGVTPDRFDSDLKPIVLQNGRKVGKHSIAFKRLWIRINGYQSWHQNPWVEAVTFEVVKELYKLSCGHSAGQCIC